MIWRRHAAALAVSAGLAVLHTWPLASDIAGLSRLDNADTALNTWIVSWVAHQLPRDPGHVFDAPIFHPERRTLAYSEHLLAQGAMAVPLRAAGLSPTATYNLLVLAGFTLSAWAMWCLVAGWTGDWAAARGRRRRLRLQCASADPLRAPPGPAPGVRPGGPAGHGSAGRDAATTGRGAAGPGPRPGRSDLGLSARLRRRGGRGRHRRAGRRVAGAAPAPRSAAPPPARSSARCVCCRCCGRTGPSTASWGSSARWPTPRSSAPAGVTTWRPGDGCTTRCGAAASSAVTTRSSPAWR